MPAEITDRLAELFTGPLAERGLDLEAVDLTRAGKRSVLRVAVDKDGGVDMDDIAEATRQVSGLLDDSEVMGESPYTLEVSSPGVDRPLTLPRHWRRNAHRLVKVTPAEGEPVTGRISGSDDEGVLLDVDGTEHRLLYGEIRKAKVQVEFKRPPGSAGPDADDEEV
ncbi:MAG TPA: ribosome maturation factor RimP [Marmoricola sp.]|jgi:ribosome maturation factor RimP|nr:ribosome maturation factor RimP [Marmoricola sp.]